MMSNLHTQCSILKLEQLYKPQRILIPEHIAKHCKYYNM